MTTGGLDPPAQIKPVQSGQKRVGDDQIGIDIGHAQHRRVPVRQTDDFEAFFP